jgi:DNA-binding GntR family transcriptional regulator
MYDPLIETQIKAAEIACGRMSPSRLKTLRESLENACLLPPDAGWDQKAAAHAAFFTVMAEAADDPVSSPVLATGAELAYELMVTVGRTASQIVINSRRRVLDHLRTGDATAAALELGSHLRTLRFMGRLTGTRRD